MADITIISTIANECRITFVDPMLAVQWAKVVAGVADPQTYVDLVQALKAPSDEVLNVVRRMVSYCLGTGA